MLQIFTNRWRQDIVFTFELRASNFGIFLTARLEQWSKVMPKGYVNLEQIATIDFLNELCNY